MSHWVLPLLLSLLIIAVLVLIRMLARGESWLLTWLRGCTIVAGAILAVNLLLLAVDATQFTTVSKAEALATISIDATSEQTFLVEVTDGSGEVWYTTLSGDIWQVQAQGLSFDGLTGALASSPVAKVSSIVSKHHDDNRRHADQVVKVSPSLVESILVSTGYESWQTLTRLSLLTQALGVRQHEYTSITVPLVDDAIYKVRWGKKFVAIDPANEIARRSLPAAS